MWVQIGLMSPPLIFLLLSVLQSFLQDSAFALICMHEPLLFCSEILAFPKFLLGKILEQKFPLQALMILLFPLYAALKPPRASSCSSISKYTLLGGDQAIVVMSNFDNSISVCDLDIFEIGFPRRSIAVMGMLFGQGMMVRGILHFLENCMGAELDPTAADSGPSDIL